MPTLIRRRKTRNVVLSLFLMTPLGLSACGSNGTGASSSASPSFSATISASPSPCVDRETVIAKVNELAEEMSDATAALVSSDAGTAAAKMREAAQSAHEAADLVEAGIPQSAHRLNQAGDALDRAATLVEEGDTQAATTSVQTANVLIADAQKEVTDAVAEGSAVAC